MLKRKYPRLSEKQGHCLLMIWDHGLTGSYTEFSHPQTRRTVHALEKKKLVQWIQNRWIVTKDGDHEARLLTLDRAKRNSA
jgi:hypothetical protein